MLGWRGEDVSPNKDGSIERFIVVSSDKKRSPAEGGLVKGKVNYISVCMWIYVSAYIFYYYNYNIF